MPEGGVSTEGNVVVKPSSVKPGWLKEKAEPVTRFVSNFFRSPTGESSPVILDITTLDSGQPPDNVQPVITQEIEVVNYRPLAPGECFDGPMPIVADWSAAQVIRQQAERLYGAKVGHGKAGDVYIQGDRATKIFHQPTELFNSYEEEFMRRYGGQAGLPKFYGVVPNGYQMEKIEGKTLKDLIREAGWGKPDVSEDKLDSALHRLLTPEQGQQLLNLIAEFHHTTGRTHSDLGKAENVFIEPDGTIRLIDPVWENVGSLSPQQELEFMHMYLTNALGIQGLEIPETITPEEGTNNLLTFKKQVQDIAVIDELNSVTALAGAVQVRVDPNGTILVNSPVKPT